MKYCSKLWYHHGKHSKFHMPKSTIWICDTGLSNLMLRNVPTDLNIMLSRSNGYSMMPVVGTRTRRIS